jgi:hypothetical protein
LLPLHCAREAFGLIRRASTAKEKVETRMSDNRPNAVITEFWREFNAWDATAIAGQESQRKARNSALWLGIIGAALGASAALLSSRDDSISGYISMTAAIALAISAWLGRELLSQDRESGWMRARILTEALKRECWYCMMGIGSYASDSAARDLQAKAGRFFSNTGLERQPIDSKSEIELPKHESIDDYISERAQDQIDYYEGAAERHGTALSKLKKWSYVLGIAGVALGVIGARVNAAQVIIPVATTGAAAVAAWIQAGRRAPMIILYQETAAQLRLGIAYWTDSAHKRSAMSKSDRAATEAEFVEASEVTMARENNSWKAEWLDKDKAQATVESINRAQQGAEGGSPSEG